MAMMRNLLAPYEQRPWAQTNWILVRLWRVRCISFNASDNPPPHPIPLPPFFLSLYLPFHSSYYAIRFQLRIGALYQSHYAACLCCFHSTLWDGPDKPATPISLFNIYSALSASKNGWIVLYLLKNALLDLFIRKCMIMGLFLIIYKSLLEDCCVVVILIYDKNHRSLFIKDSVFPSALLGHTHTG